MTTQQLACILCLLLYMHYSSPMKKSLPLCRTCQRLPLHLLCAACGWLDRFPDFCGVRVDGMLHSISLPHASHCITAMRMPDIVCVRKQHTAHARDAVPLVYMPATLWDIYRQRTFIGTRTAALPLLRAGNPAISFFSHYYLPPLHDIIY